MRRLIYALFVIMLTAGGAFAAEVTTLTTPLTKPSQTTCRVNTIYLDITAKTVDISVIGNNNEVATKTYNASTNPTGAAVLSTLNTANLTTNSLIKRVLTRLATDAVCVGTVTGTPD